MRIGIIGAGPGGSALRIPDFFFMLPGTVWTTQCSNYFRATSGRVVTQSPRSAGTFWSMTRRFKAADFIFEPA